MARVDYIAAVYGYEPVAQALCVQDNARALAELEIMGQRMEGKRDRLVALYVPKKAVEYHKFYRKGQVGCIVGLVSLGVMPSGRKVSDFRQVDPRNGKIRWPYGWPIRPEFSMEGDWPPLERIMLEEFKAAGSKKFMDFASDLHYSPVPLAAHPGLARRILSCFTSNVNATA